MASPYTSSVVPSRTIAHSLSIHQNTTAFSSRISLFHASRKLFNGLGVSCKPKYDAYDEMRLEPIFGSWSFSKEEKCLNINVPGLEKTESDKSLCVFLYMPGVKKKDVKVSVEDTTLLVIEGETHDQVRYEGGMWLPENIDKTSSDIKGEIMQDGMLKLTFPKLNDKELTTSVFTNVIPKLGLKLGLCCFFNLASVFMLFSRSTIEGLCPEPFDSFTMYKEEIAEGLHTSFMTGLEKIELTRGGACVSLNMHELKIEDVKSYFKRDILFIEGKSKTKTNKVHYITGIRIPKSIIKKRNMIKTDMQDGMYKATLPYVTAEIKIN